MEKFEDPKQPKAYISGPITGRSDAFERFQDAEKELKGFEFIPVNPFDNGLQDDPSIKYTDHLLKDLKMLSECQIIYMLKDWQTSRGARIEYSFAVNMGIEVMFESVVENERNARIKDVKVIDAIRNAIHEVMDLKFAAMCDRHDRFGFFARMIFAHHCKNEGQMSVKQIAAMIHRDETTIRYSLTKYDGEYQFNRIFRNMAERVDDILSSFPIEKSVQMQCKCIEKEKKIYQKKVKEKMMNRMKRMKAIIRAGVMCDPSMIDKGITKIAKHVEELFDEPVEVTEKIFMKKPDDNPETIIPLVTHHDDVRNGINFHRKHNKKKR